MLKKLSIALMTLGFATAVIAQSEQNTPPPKGDMQGSPAPDFIQAKKANKEPAIPTGNCTTTDGGFLRGRSGVLPLKCKHELASGKAFLPRKQFPAGTADKEQVRDFILVRGEPNVNGKILQKVSPRQRLIAFYHQNGWYKVGDPKTGGVGWVNMAQYKSVMEKQYAPRIHQVFVEMEEDGNQPTKVQAYENGKKLNPQQSKQLYSQIQNHMRAQQMRWQEQMNHMVREEDRMFNQAFQPAVYSPIIIIDKTPMPSKPGKPQTRAAKKAVSN